MHTPGLHNKTRSTIPSDLVEYRRRHTPNTRRTRDSSVTGRHARHRAGHPGCHQRLSRPQRSDAVGVAGGLPHPQGRVSSGLRPDRPHHLCQPGDRVVAAAGRWRLHRQAPETLFVAHGNGVHAGRAAPAVCGADLRCNPYRRRHGRHRLVNISPRVVESRPSGVRWAARLRAVALPGWRQYRIINRPAARRLHRAAVRPAQHRVVRRRGVVGDGDSDARQRLVPPGASSRCAPKVRRFAQVFPPAGCEWR